MYLVPSRNDVGRYILSATIVRYIVTGRWA